MDNKWNYKIDLKTLDVFDLVEKEYDIDFPNDLKTFIVEHNAASPDQYCVDVCGIERVYSETLSFNMEEPDATTFLSIKDAIKDRNYIPFALDPFGNFFCYSIKDSEISFYNHEEESFDNTGKSLDDFILSLY